VLQLSLESNSLNEQQLYDFGIYRVRQQLAPVPGVTLPTPAGGKYRQIMVDIDPNKLLSRGLTLQLVREPTSFDERWTAYSSLCLSRVVPTRRTMASSSWKMFTTSVRFISPFRRSIGRG